MNVLFRTDASLLIGSGHVMRCITLARELARLGAQCHFYMREHTGHRAEAVEAAGFQVTLLGRGEGAAAVTDGEPRHAHWLGTHWKEDAEQFLRALNGQPPADWAVVDHYGLDRRWEQAVGTVAQKTLVIDDLADRHHECALLLDQNLGRNEQDYRHLTPVDSKRLCGPRYALLRDEFATARKCALERRQHRRSVQRVLISMGGVDADDATGACLTAMDQLPQAADLAVDVVMGRNAPHLHGVQQLASQVGFQCDVHVETSEMAGLMSRADVALGAAGSSAWERCTLGLPSLLVVLAENQWPGTTALDRAGAASVLGTPGQIAEGLRAAFDQVRDPAALWTMGDCASKVCDGLGAARVVLAMAT